MASREQVNLFIKELGALAQAEYSKRIAAGKQASLPSVCIAQSACETGWGTASIMTKAHAYFGIKATSGWCNNGGKYYVADTQECYDGSNYTNIVDAFRAYDSLEESVADYFSLIADSGIYRVDNSSVYNCISAIQETPYATSPTYVNTITSIVNGYDLTQYDRCANVPVSTETINCEGDMSNMDRSELNYRTDQKACLLLGRNFEEDAIEAYAGTMEAGGLTWYGYDQQLLKSTECVKRFIKLSLYCNILDKRPSEVSEKDVDWWYAQYMLNDGMTFSEMIEGFSSDYEAYFKRYNNM